MADTITLKSGDTLMLDAQLTDAEGQPIDMSGWTVACQVRDNRGWMVADLAPVLTMPALGQYEIRKPTTGWAPGTYRADLRYTDAGGNVLSTESFNVRLLDAVSQI